MQHLSPLLCAFLLIGCADSISVEPAVALCQKPQKLPERALNDRDIEIYWGRDRDALKTCGERVLALIQ